MFRLGVAVASNILIIIFFPRLAMWSGNLANTRRLLLFAFLAATTLLMIVPVIKSKDPGYKISAIMLALLPAAVLVGSIWTLLF